MKVKICGITNLDDARDAVALGADAIGFIFEPSSPRYVTVHQVQEVVLSLPPFITLTGVFCNMPSDEINRIADECKLDLIQLHGNEPAQDCLKLNRRVIKAIRVKELEDLNLISQYKGAVSGVLLDTKVDGKLGGTGQVFDWGLAIRAKEFDIPIILAGGISVNNIKKAIELVDPYGVDISSSVEAQPGKKDYNLMKELIDAAKL